MILRGERGAHFIVGADEGHAFVDALGCRRTPPECRPPWPRRPPGPARSDRSARCARPSTLLGDQVFDLGDLRLHVRSRPAAPPRSLRRPVRLALALAPASTAAQNGLPAPGPFMRQHVGGVGRAGHGDQRAERHAGQKQFLHCGPPRSPEIRPPVASRPLLPGVQALRRFLSDEHAARPAPPARRCRPQG